MAAAQLHQPSERRRVKVYELRNSDWFDRGTGFCMGQLVDVSQKRPDGRASSPKVPDADDPSWRPSTERAAHLRRFRG